MGVWAFRHWTPFNELGREEASSPGYRHAIERQRTKQALPYGLDVWHGAKVLRILWAEDGVIEVASFIRGTWEDEVLTLQPRHQRRATRHSMSYEQTMADAIYRVVHRDDDSFSVEITRSGVLPQTAVGFATEAEANDWVAQDKRLWQAADPFRTPAGRRWRGV